MFKKLTKKEAKEYYSEYYPKILAHWQKYGHEPRPMILEKLNIKNKKIIDIGCGNGLMLKTLAKNNEVWGVDISSKLLKEAKNNGIKTILHNLDSKENISLPDKFFEIVLLFEIFEHTFNPKLLLKKSYQLLNDNGVIYMTTPNKGFPKREKMIQESLESALKKIYPGKIPEIAKRFPDINIQQLEKIKKSLTPIGLEIEKIYGWSWSWENLSSKEKNNLWVNYLNAPDLLIKIRKIKKSNL